MALLLQILSLALWLPMQASKTPAGNVPHPFFVSVTEISQNNAEKSLEVSCKFFTDDFEETLEKMAKTPLDIKTAKDKATFDKLIPAYINQHFTLNADGKAASLSYVGFEVEKESVYCYFEILNAPAVKQMDISNTLLYDFKNEQINIMHVTLNGKRQSTKLDYPASKASFRW